MPGNFIGEIETTSVIAPLTDLVLATALNELTTCAFLDNLRVNINLAPKHIEMHCFPRDVTATITQRPMRFQVVFEITERGLLAGLASSHDNLMGLKAYGVKYAVDDFGTGNINLAVALRFETAHQDRPAIHHRGSRPRKEQLVEGIAFLANKLHMTVVAEGVENSEQRDAFKETGIGYAQGYLFQRSANILEFERIYRHLHVVHRRA